VASIVVEPCSLSPVFDGLEREKWANEAGGQANSRPAVARWLTQRFGANALAVLVAQRSVARHGSASLARADRFTCRR